MNLVNSKQSVLSVNLVHGDALSMRNQDGQPIKIHPPMTVQELAALQQPLPSTLNT